MDFLVVLGHLVDAAGYVIQPVGYDLFGDLLFVEENDFLDGAHAALQVVADGDDLADDDGRARKRLQNAQLAALDALGDFDFAFAGEQRHRAHLPEIHSDGVVGFLERAGREVQLHVLAGFELVKFLVAPHLGAFEDINALRADGGQQVLEVVGGVHVVRDQVVHLVVREVTLFLPHIDQFFDIVVLVV